MYDFGGGEEQCVGDSSSRDSCRLTSSQLGVVDAIAALRMIVATLSFIGAISIIILSIARKQVCSSKVYPIFVLSVADLLLSVLWIVGGSVWLRRLSNRVWCYAISLPTIILECISVNVTIVYALLVYSNIKKKDLNSILNKSKSAFSEQVWRPTTTITAYIIAWLLPTVILMAQFGALAGQTTLVTHANHCSCWCLPVYGNVLPLAGITERQVSNATRQYVYDVNILLATYGLVLGTHYLVGFILLVVIYTKVLRFIKRIRIELELTRRQYGAIGATIIKGQSKAKRRVVAFLTVFVISGTMNFILSYMYMLVEITNLPGGPTNFHLSTEIVTILNVIIGLQSFLVPLQGFLNAIVYGWTREDISKVLAIGIQKREHESMRLERYQENPITETQQEVESEINYSYNTMHHEAEENSYGSEDSTEQ